MWLLFCSIWFSFGNLAHGDLDARIAELSISIQEYPDSIQLYLVRGELLVLHEEYPAARVDFEHCLHHQFSSARVFLGLSKALYLSGVPDSSLYYVEQALVFDPAHPSALEWKGTVLRMEENYCAAAAACSYLISLTTAPSPSLYLDASNAWLQCDLPESENKAIQSLRDGLSRLGRLHVLEMALVDTYLHYQRYTDALQVQSEIIQHWSFKAVPYLDRAEIYLQFHEVALAKSDLLHALDALEQLPAYKTNTPAMKSVKSKIISSLEEIEN